MKHFHCCRESLIELIVARVGTEKFCDSLSTRRDFPGQIVQSFVPVRISGIREVFSGVSDANIRSFDLYLKQIEIFFAFGKTGRSTQCRHEQISTI